MGRTLAEKVWDAHVVKRVDGEPDLLYIDVHLVHEVTSPQAFDGLRASGPSTSTELTSPPGPQRSHVASTPIAESFPEQVDTMRRNCAEFDSLHGWGISRASSTSSARSSA